VHDGTNQRTELLNLDAEDDNQGILSPALGAQGLP